MKKTKENKTNISGETKTWRWGITEAAKALEKRPSEADAYIVIWGFYQLPEILKPENKQWILKRIGRKGKSFSLALEQACYCIGRHMFPEAIAQLKKCIEIRPQVFLTYYFLGLCYRRLCLTSEMEKSLKQALPAAPYFLEHCVHYHLGCALLEPANIDESVSHMSKALEIYSYMRKNKLFEKKPWIFQIPGIQIDYDLIYAYYQIALGLQYFMKYNLIKAMDALLVSSKWFKKIGDKPLFNYATNLARWVFFEIKVHDVFNCKTLDEVREVIDTLLKLQFPDYMVDKEHVQATDWEFPFFFIYSYLFILKDVLNSDRDKLKDIPGPSEKDYKAAIKMSYLEQHKQIITILYNVVCEVKNLIVKGGYNSYKDIPPEVQDKILMNFKPAFLKEEGIEEIPIGEFDKSILEANFTSATKEKFEGIIKDGLKKSTDSILRSLIEKNIPATSEREIGKKVPEGEKAEYVVFLPKPRGIRAFVDNKTRTENQVHKNYSTKKEKFDIFVYEQNVYRKVMDEGKTKMVSLNPSISSRGLLILFLKYKGVHLPYVEMYHRAFIGTKEYDEKAKSESDVMNTLKNAVNELKREFEYIKGFSIPRAKNFQYICEGDFEFCLILKKSTNEHYTMLFDKFKVTEPIPEEA